MKQLTVGEIPQKLTEHEREFLDNYDHLILLAVSQVQINENYDRKIELTDRLNKRRELFGMEGLKR